MKGGAKRRWLAWAGSQGGASEPPIDLITWELIWDGLLVDEVDGDAEAQVRFAHPTLREFVVAIHVSNMSREDQAPLLDEHRWFDRGWQQILPMATALSEQPEDLLTVFSASSENPWHEQSLLAGRCLAATDPALVSEERRGQIVAGVELAVLSPSIFDRDRGLATLAEMIRGGIPEARAVASRLTTSDALRQSERWGLACDLAASGDHTQCERVREFVTDRELPLSIRARAVAALAAIEDPDGKPRVEDAIARVTTDRRRLSRSV